MKKYSSAALMLFCLIMISVWSCKPTKQIVEEVKPIEMNEELAFGKKINETKCATCHKAKNPANYTAAEWEMQVNRMAARAKTTTDENNLLVKYGTSIAKQ
jgi:cytochrome c5